LAWLELNGVAQKVEYENKHKELEDYARPIMESLSNENPSVGKDFQQGVTVDDLE